MAHHVYTCKFGTFLYDNEKSRYRENYIKEKTVSIWTYINDNVYDFLNPFYKQSSDLLQPNSDYMALEFWKEHFLVWSEFSNYQPDKTLLSSDDHKEQIVKDLIEENTLMKKRIKELEDELAKSQVKPE